MRLLLADHAGYSLLAMLVTPYQPCQLAAPCWPCLILIGHASYSSSPMSVSRSLPAMSCQGYVELAVDGSSSLKRPRSRRSTGPMHEIRAGVPAKPTLLRAATAIQLAGASSWLTDLQVDSLVSQSQLCPLL